MNKKYRDVADNYQISEDIREPILRGMGIEDFNKNPSKDKLEGFTIICEQVRNGKHHDSAIAEYLQSRELSSVTKSNSLSSESIGEVSRQMGIETGKQMARIVPPLQKQGISEVVEGFNRGLREGFQEAFKEIDIYETFEEFSMMDIEDIRQGKLGSGSSNAALPQSSSE